MMDLWLPGGMVDAADSKSAVGNNVRVRVSGEPPKDFPNPRAILEMPLFLINSAS